MLLERAAIRVVCALWGVLVPLQGVTTGLQVDVARCRYMVPLHGAATWCCMCFGAGMLVLMQGAACGCCCHSGRCRCRFNAAVRAVCALERVRVHVRFRASMLAPVQDVAAGAGAALGCCCQSGLCMLVPLQGVCALWTDVGAAGCRCRVPLQGAAAGCGGAG